MAEPAAAVAPAPAQGPQREEETTFQRVMGIVQQVLIMYLITKFITNYVSPQKPATPPVPSAVTPESTTAVNVPPGQPNPFDLPPKQVHLAPEWKLGDALDMHVYLSTSPSGDVFSQHARTGIDSVLPHFVWENISFGDWKESRVAEYDVKLPESVLHNASLWADVIVTKQGASPSPFKSSFKPKETIHFRKLLTRYMPKVKVRKVKSLLSKKSGEEDEQEEEPEQPDEIVSYWHQNLTLALVSEAPVLQYPTIAPPVAQHIHLVQGVRDATGSSGYYYPIIYPNEFWHLKEQYMEINSTTTIVPLQIVFQPMGYFKFQMFASLSFGFEQAAKQQGASSGAELDEIKRMFVETNPWFLGLTATVSLLHMLFEMLAFTSDVSHWRNKKELVGVSLRTILTNVFVQVVVLLYLIDNNENTSWMIIFTSGMGAVIEAWKITKAVDISVIPSRPGSTLPYTLDIKDKHVLSEDEKKTQEYDQLAFRYVSYVTIPALGIYAVYSLVYDQHRSWYSFVITTLTSFVYMFGFAQLVPQLIINYKLKSVAHMPMKAMVYKTLGTVVDDLFAFCIKMPILHRLACFRDDVVFLVFLYQRWIYRIDPKRVNEYGQVMASDVAEASKTTLGAEAPERASEVKSSQGKTKPKASKSESKKNR